MNMPIPEVQARHSAKDQTRFAALWRPALVQAFVKLDPRQLKRSPVMLVVALTAVLTTVLCFAPGSGVSTGVAVQIALWLWFTVLFANFAEALAEGRGKARADSLKAGSQGLTAQRRKRDGSYETVAASALRKDDVVRVVAGEMIPGDGEVLEGIAAVNEAAITGESAPVIRESGGDRSAVTGNTRLVSDWLLIRITSNPGESTLDRMIALVEGAKRQKTPNEIALDILLIGLTLIFLIVVVTLQPFARFVGGSLPLIFLAALLVTLIPTTIGGLLSAIGIAGMDRLVRLNVIARSGRAVEAAGDVHTLMLDKTGTITFGNRRCSALHAAPGITARELGRAPCWPRWRTTPPRASRSSSTCASCMTSSNRPPGSSRRWLSAPRRACRASTCSSTATARAPSTPCWRSLACNAWKCPRHWPVKWSALPRAAVHRCWYASTSACSA